MLISIFIYCLYRSSNDAEHLWVVASELSMGLFEEAVRGLNRSFPLPNFKSQITNFKSLVEGKLGFFFFFDKKNGK